MRRNIIILSVALSLTFFVNIIFASAKETINFNGKKVETRYGPMQWKTMGSDPSGFQFNQSIMLLVHMGIVTQENGDSLIALFPKKEKVLVLTGNTFEGMIFGGRGNSIQKINIGMVTVGKGFDSQFNGKPASAWKVALEDSYRRIVLYFFENNLNGKIQCNNLCWKFEPLIITIKGDPYPVPYPVPEPYPVPGPTVHDTVYVDVEKIVPQKPCIKVSAWTAFAHDEFSQEAEGKANFGSYQLSNYKNRADGHFIFATEQEITAKICVDKWAIVANMYHEYEDGPHGGNGRLGIEKNWRQKSFLELGSALYYRQFIHRWTEETPLPGGSIYVRNMGMYFGTTEIGPYLQFDQFLDSSGKDHLRLFAWQGVRPAVPKLGITEVKASVKLEPKKLYLFLGGKYQITPYEVISDSLTAPKFEHVSWEPRIGYSVSKDVILFLRHRGINHDQWESKDVNFWSKYTRRDFSAGLFYRPSKFLGIKNLYLELLAGYSGIKERYENKFLNSEDDLMEVKLTLFWNSKF